MRLAGLPHVVAAGATIAFGVHADAQVERFTLNGAKVAVHNVAGRITIEHGTGPGVVVEVTRGGVDARRLALQQLENAGRTSLCIMYPQEHIIYRPKQGAAAWNVSTGDESVCRGGVKGIFGGRKIEVRSRGEGVEAWADVRILVPPGADLKVWDVAGEITAENVRAALELDATAARVSTHATTGALHVNAESGDARVIAHHGDLTIEAGSGDVKTDSVSAATMFSVDAGSGGVAGAGVETDAFRVKAGSGKVQFAGLSARRARIEASAGDMTVGFVSRVDSLSAESGSGVITLRLPATFGAEVEAQTGSGEITSDFPVRPPLTKRGELRGSIGDGHGRVTIDAGSGDIRLVRAK